MIGKFFATGSLLIALGLLNTSYADSARNQANNMLLERGWISGPNTRNDGSEFFVAIGTATIGQSAGSTGFVSARQSAFDRAMLEAKAELLKFQQLEISRNVTSFFIEPSDTQERARINEIRKQGFVLEAAKATASAAATDIADLSELQTGSVLANQAQLLIIQQADNALRELGLDPSKPVAEQEIQKILSQEQFSRMVTQSARGELRGMMAFQVFENVPKGEKGEIAVVGISSQRLSQLAGSLFDGKSVDAPLDLKSLISKIPDEDQLPYTFGVQMAKDSSGVPVLIAFAQAEPRTSSTRSLQSASAKAQLLANGMIRSFAGEQMAMSDQEITNEINTELSNGVTVADLDASFEQRREAFASAMQIKGLTTLKEWDSLHPETNQPIAGVVVAWAPQTAGFAGLINRQQQVTPTSSSNKSKATESSYSGTGAAASDDF